MSCKKIFWILKRVGKVRNFFLPQKQKLLYFLKFLPNYQKVMLFQSLKTRSFQPWPKNLGGREWAFTFFSDMLSSNYLKFMNTH